MIAKIGMAHKAKPGQTNRRAFMRRLVTVSSAAMVGGVPFAATARAQRRISRLRLSATHGKTRLVFDLDGPVQHSLFALNNPARLVIDVEDARLAYRARVRSEEILGQAYLEMWCQISGRGEFFSRSLHSPLKGTTEWTSQETPFFLEKNQNPDSIKLNIVIDGSGAVWVASPTTGSVPVLETHCCL